jgi:hypothetical protein
MILLCGLTDWESGKAEERVEEDVGFVGQLVAVDQWSGQVNSPTRQLTAWTGNCMTLAQQRRLAC